MGMIGDTSKTKKASGPRRGNAIMFTRKVSGGSVMTDKRGGFRMGK